MRLSLEGREINPSLIFNISRVQLRHGGHHRILARRCLCGHTARGVCTSRYRSSTLLYTMNCGAMAHARALLSLKRQWKLSTFSFFAAIVLNYVLPNRCFDRMWIMGNRALNPFVGYCRMLAHLSSKNVFQQFNLDYTEVGYFFVVKVELKRQKLPVLL